MNLFIQQFRKIADNSKNRPILLIFLLGLLACVLAISGDTPKAGNENAISIPPYSGNLYEFAPGRELVLESARPIRHPQGPSIATALDLLARHLEETYFFKTAEGEETHIRFAVQHLHFVEAAQQRHCIAVIDMTDKNEFARRHFFQGSFGGQSTFFMIAATFLQAQNDPPLLDGLILLYNGKIFPKMDHIDFSGIVTPAAVKRVVRQVVERSKSRSSH